MRDETKNQEDDMNSTHITTLTISSKNGNSAEIEVTAGVGDDGQTKITWGYPGVEVKLLTISKIALKMSGALAQRLLDVDTASLDSVLIKIDNFNNRDLHDVEWAAREATAAGRAAARDAKIKRLRVENATHELTWYRDATVGGIPEIFRDQDQDYDGHLIEMVEWPLEDNPSVELTFSQIADMVEKIDRFRAESVKISTKYESDHRAMNRAMGNEDDD